MQTRSRARATSASAASTSPAHAVAAQAAAAPLAAPSGSSSTASARRDTPASVDDYDIDDYADSGSGFEYESDGPVASVGEDGDDDDNDSDIIMVERTAGRGTDQSKRLAEPVVVLSSDEEPPPERAKPKGKLTSRKQFAADLAELSKKFNSTDSDSPVSGTYLGVIVGADLRAMILRRRTHAALKRDEGDDMIQLVLKHPDFARGLKISLYFPELSGYPKSHETMCFSGDEEVPDSVQAAISEVAQ